ncbi:MAG: helix-turn-helix domain-containing protein [Phycisphaera sp.]|nr:helix-turn-helix domain-containing protein [Phycisphaera sp.]
MGKDRRIAVMMDIDKPYKRHTETFTGIHKYAEERGGWRLIVDDWADRNLPARAGQASPYDGMIGRISKLGAERANRLGVPVVNVWLNSPAHDVPSVLFDTVACGRLRAEHLLARGFRNFGVLAHASDRSTLVQGEAFERTVREAGCDNFSAVSLAEHEPTRMGIGELDLSEYQQWKRAMRDIDRWMDTWRLPIGLYLFEVAIARVLIEKCFDRGWRVPEDVAMVAGYNEEVQCEHPSPGITSLELPNERIGYEAARMLDELMNEADKQKGRRKRSKPVAADPVKLLLPPVGIVARRSTDFFAVDDDLIRRALRYIDENLHRPLTIDMIADALEVSRRKLTGRFSEQMHHGIAAEIQRLRVERAKRELTATDQPIQQIARRAGFASARTFNDAFRAEVGCSPRAYRQQHAPTDT